MRRCIHTLATKDARVLSCSASCNRSAFEQLSSFALCSIGRALTQLRSDHGDADPGGQVDASQSVKRYKRST